jgi:hypothetical protein
MKRLLSLLAIGALSVALANDATAQSRDLGGRRLILDDGAAGKLTISYAGPGNSTFVIPAGGVTAVPVGTTTNSTLSWNGTVWTENANLLAPAAGGLNLTGAPLAASNSLLKLTAGVGATDGTYYGVNSAISTGTGGVFDVVGVRGIASGTDDLAIGGQFGATGSGTNIGVDITAGGLRSEGGINNTNDGIINTGAITGATNITASGAVQAASVTATNTLSTDILGGSGANRFAQRALISSFPVVGSTYTISNDNVTATSVIVITIEDPDGVIPAGYIIGNRVVGSSFDVTFPVAADGNDIINYMIIN